MESFFIFRLNTNFIYVYSIDKFLVMAGNAEHFDGNASVEDALKKLNLKSQFDLLPGMAVSLMPHQLIGVAWMLEKERGPLKGGCLADDMGLGKTVQMYVSLPFRSAWEAIGSRCYWFFF